ncbi:pol [Symbiodinium sp. CCMP2592]|nr:pol [Symbiodinium sp. CCMP2592]
MSGAGKEEERPKLERFDGTQPSTYKRWRRKAMLMLMALPTTYTKDRWGAKLMEYLAGEAEEVCEALPIEKLVKEGGHDLVFEALDAKHKELQKDDPSPRVVSQLDSSAGNGICQGSLVYKEVTAAITAIFPQGVARTGGHKSREVFEAHGDADDEIVMSDHGSSGPPEPSSDELESTERTPRDQQVYGPPTAADLAPKGPPRPVPVHYDAASHAMPPALADPATVSDDNADGEDHDGSARPGPTHTGSRRRPRASTSSSSSSDSETHNAAHATDEDDEEEPDADAAADAADSHTDGGYWSETSLVLEGQELADACDTFVTLYRRQLTEQPEGINNRSRGSRHNVWKGRAIALRNFRVCTWPLRLQLLLCHPGCLQPVPLQADRYACSPPDRSSGILVMLSKKYFEDPAVHEPIPGRVLQVRATVKTSQLPITIVGIYQHVWRTHLSAIQNLELRRGVWHAISTIVQQTPQRHHLLIAGDFNANLTPQHPHVGGAATRSPAANHSPELQQLLAEGDLCALNTWHTPHRDTYVTPTHNSQIDFVVVRCAEAKGKAKHCIPLVRFPVAGWRQAGHRPLHAELWLRPFRRQEPAHLPAQHRCQLDVLQQAVADQTEPAQAMQTHVEARVQQLLQQSSPNASCLQASLNQILWDAAEKFFPVKPKPDNRISNNPQYKASARQTWALYARLKSASVVTFSHIWRKWRLLVQFRKASRALRQQSKDLKRAFYEQQIQEAEEAAARHDQRTLYQIVKRMAPKSYKTASRLLGPDGRLMTPSGELQAILQHGKQTFAALIDVEHPLEPDEPLHIPEQSLQDELRALKLRKAVPAHIAPAAVWKQCHACLGSCLASALNDHFALPAQQPLQHDWKDCYIKWLPKPNKPPVSVEALRPIGLQCPTTKALAGALRERLLQVLHPALASLPQFAYIKQRGTQEALLRVHMHFHQVASILKDNIVDRFQQKAGKKAAKCIGAMSLSLDLSRAFDSASRPEVYQTMLHHGVPKEVVNAVQQLHLHALYKYQVGQNSYGATSTTNGVKQGCKIAPYLWCFLTLRFMELLMQSRSEQWLAHIMTIFADDVWSNWIIRSLTDFKRAKADLELILTILESLHLTVNFTKTAILLVLEGKDAAKILRDHTITKAGQHLLRLTVSGRDCTLPIKAQHEYLGSIVSYQGRKNLNADHRVKAGNGRYQALRRTLNGHHVLTAHNRIRLWTACVQTSAHYSLTAVGLTSKGLDKLTKASTKQLRAALRQPAHISHTTTAQIWQQAGHPLPAQQLAQSLEQYVLKQQARATTAPDITTMPQVLQYAEEQLRQLQILASTPLREERTVDEASVQTVACPECGESFASLNGMRIHCQRTAGYRHTQSAPLPSMQWPTQWEDSQNAVSVTDASSGISSWLNTSTQEHVKPLEVKASFANPSKQMHFRSRVRCHRQPPPTATLWTWKTYLKINCP